MNMIKFEKYNKSNQEVYVPINLARNYRLKHNDKLVVEIFSNNKKFVFPARLRFRCKKDGDCYRFQIPKEFQNFLLHKKKFKIIKLNRPKKVKLLNHELDLLGFNEWYPEIYEWIDGNLIIFDNIKYPLIIERKINLIDFGKYLGLYFSDGSKTNHYCCIASTKEIARLALFKYHNFIKNPRYTKIICHRLLNSDNRDIGRIKKDLLRLWKEFNVKRVQFNGTRKSLIWHDNLGIFRFDDSRKITLDIHKWLIKKLLESKNKRILLEFLKGGLLGDGSVSLRRKKVFQYITITCHINELEVWKLICDNLNFKYDIRKNKNCAVIRLNSYLDASYLLKCGAFREYTKRKEKLIVGLRNRTETFFLNSKSKSDSRFYSFIYVNKMGDLMRKKLVNHKGDLTSKGEKFINELKTLNLI